MCRHVDGEFYLFLLSLNVLPFVDVYASCFANPTGRNTYCSLRRTHCYSFFVYFAIFAVMAHYFANPTGRNILSPDRTS